VIRLPAIFLLTVLARGTGTLDWHQLAPLPEPLGVAAPFAGVQGADRFVIPSGEVGPGVRSPEIWTFRAR